MASQVMVDASYAMDGLCQGGLQLAPQVRSVLL